MIIDIDIMRELYEEDMLNDKGKWWFIQLLERDRKERNKEPQRMNQR